jgi:hypothetical protein
LPLRRYFAGTTQYDVPSVPHHPVKAAVGCTDVARDGAVVGAGVRVDAEADLGVSFGGVADGKGVVAMQPARACASTMPRGRSSSRRPSVSDA